MKAGVALVALAVGIAAVDISVSLTEPGNTNAPHDGHPSAQANRAYAEKLLNFLRTQPFVKPLGTLPATNSPALPSAP